LVRGERWVVDARGSNEKQLDDGLNLNRVAGVGKGAGGGYLFFGPFGLYSGSTFDGELVRVAPTVSRASAGPGFLLVAFDDGRVRSIDRKTGKAGPALPLGTIDIGASDDGAAVAITHGARAFVTRDKGATWTDISKEVGTPVDVIENGGKLFVTDRGGEVLRVDMAGTTRTTLPAQQRAVFDPSWTRAEAPLEIAVQRGVRATSERAWVSDAGTIFEISTVTGEVVASEKGVLPANGSCEQVSLSDSVLFICSQSDSASVFRRPKRGSVTKLERTFSSNAAFLVGAGDALLFAGPCDGAASKPGVACTRSKDGVWSTLDRSGEIADTPPTEPLRFVGWVPKEDGAYLLVAGKAGGLWDAKTGAKTKLEEAEIARIEPLVQARSGGRTNIVDRLAVVDGVIVGLGPDNVGFKLTESGKRVERSPFRMSSVASARAQVLGRDQVTGTLWQSTDWGFTFTEVDGPPDPPNTRDDVRKCSEAGCAFNQWLRIGWEAVPVTARAPKKSFPPQPDPPIAKLTELECTASGPMARKSVLAINDDRAGFGAESLKTDPSSYLALYPRGIQQTGLGFSEASNLRAVATGRLPSFDGPSPSASAVSEARRYRYIEPFDPKAAVREGSLRLGDLVDAARSSSGSSPDLSLLDERGASLPVLSDPPGVLLSGPSGPLIWLRGKDKPIALGVPGEGPINLLSAVQTGPEEVAALFEDASGGTSLRSLGRGRATERFTLAPLPASHSQRLPDVLAMGPDGTLAVIRITTDSPPSKEDPALLLRSGEAPQPLAPWSTLEVEGSPACASMQGHRALIQTAAPWLSLGLTAESFGRERPGLLRVRWNATQVCLEAVELPFGAHELPNGSQAGSYIAARFGKDAAAGHVMIAEGAALFEPRTCKRLK